uniref:IS1 transposase n=1 Tax=Candidatus Kentrum sp. TC TaxID=2126339 RepID=A0A450Y781_9GAMM|nr:MAG: IS1 transposase [Candidatus Kentron sp. TC]
MMFSMNRLDTKTQKLILNLLVEGNSLRASARIADVSRNTVDKLLNDAGKACLEFQDKTLRELPCKKIQCDEIWSFVYSKDKNVPADKQGQFGYGDVWTWTAIDADTKLVPCWHVDTRDGDAAKRFISGLAGRLANRVQLTTDGHKPYLEAIEGAFGGDIDYAMLVKLYGKTMEGEKRYSPSVCTGAKKVAITGNPDKAEVSTSYVERQNLTMRMSMRRFTRLTNAFSKKVENHMHAISLHYMHYNFCRIHQTLKVTPAMEAGITDRVWEIQDILNLIPMEAPKERGPYKKAA